MERRRQLQQQQYQQRQQQGAGGGGGGDDGGDDGYDGDGGDDDDDEEEQVLRIIDGLPEYDPDEVEEEFKRMEMETAILTKEEFQEAVYASQCWLSGASH